MRKIHLYQSHTWAKFTGDADYDQPFHCDFSNHTLTVPAEDPGQRTVNFVIYISPVTDALGAMHYVHKDDAYEILGPGAVGAPPEHQEALREVQRSAAAGRLGYRLQYRHLSPGHQYDRPGRHALHHDG